MCLSGISKISGADLVRNNPGIFGLRTTLLWIMRYPAFSIPTCKHCCPINRIVAKKKKGRQSPVLFVLFFSFLFFFKLTSLFCLTLINGRRFNVPRQEQIVLGKLMTLKSSTSTIKGLKESGHIHVPITRRVRCVFLSKYIQLFSDPSINN
jgi:hypothetical protein